MKEHPAVRLISRELNGTFTPIKSLSRSVEFESDFERAHRFYKERVCNGREFTKTMKLQIAFGAVDEVDAESLTVHKNENKLRILTSPATVFLEYKTYEFKATP